LAYPARLIKFFFKLRTRAGVSGKRCWCWVCSQVLRQIKPTLGMAGMAMVLGVRHQHTYMDRTRWTGCAGTGVCQVDEWICISWTVVPLSAPYHLRRMKALSSSQSNRACAHSHAQGPPTQPIVIGVGASKLPPAGKRVQKFAAPTVLAKALRRNVLRGAGGTARRAVMVLPLNEHRTTVCCSKCGAATQAATVWDREAGVQRPSMRLRECLQCRRRCNKRRRRGPRQQGPVLGAQACNHHVLGT